jgi:hypothetical protein
MSRGTKDDARRMVKVYSGLLQERAIISDVTSTEERGQTVYEFYINERRSYPTRCYSIKELANLLCAMWSAYLRGRHDVGLDDSDSILVYG